MRLLFAFLAGLGTLISALPGPARAGSCRSEIAALFHGGALDPFARPPHVVDTTVLTVGGQVKKRQRVVFDTPMKSLTGLPGQQMTLVIGGRSWSGPTAQGPWRQNLTMRAPGDFEAEERASRDQMSRNISDPVCRGVVEHEGQRYRVYEFFTRTDADASGRYFGARHVVYIDPKSGLLMLQERSGDVADYLPQPGTERRVMRYRYDPSLRLSAPG
ncbi:hypothetical protein [Pseudodonghicola flavimaris]|uniref:Uncharacterized protein n=1 Tax=Pseudodonghicola flavimaris TaxID=3050036 RepID=A0ABT7EWC1_9RHOB|nr:hypothetical protein [Pseudodonghicola flavimaris]MDK3016639.1 hypothetical protein [Pseudodonghicola flavimaris]